MPVERPARIAVVYYSATGNVHAMARAVADCAAREGAEVRLRPGAEVREGRRAHLSAHTRRSGELAFAPRGVGHTPRALLVITRCGFERYFARMAAERQGTEPLGWAHRPSRR